MDLAYHMLSGLPKDIGELSRMASSENFGMVHRLIDDYVAERNRFSENGECLYAAFVDGRTIAIGGINVDPYYSSPALGRIRHVYVHPDYRRSGVGTGLMKLIECHGEKHFATFQLFTAAQVAARFYEALNYVPVQGRWKVSHAKQIGA